MSFYDHNSVNLYLDYINKELYKTKFTISRSSNFNKILFVGKVNDSSYWFPAKSGVRSYERFNKLRSKKYFKNNSIYKFEGFLFLSTFEIFITNTFKINVTDTINSPIFKNYLSLINESVRRHEIKKNLQRVLELATTSWKYSRCNNYVSIKYYFDFESHRNFARLRKLNFIAVNSWFPLHKKKWLFAHRNMRNFYLKFRKTERFEYRYFRPQGMSFAYWAKQQLQYNYFNQNSSDFLIDPRSSSLFMPSQLPVAVLEFKTIFGSDLLLCFSILLIFWATKESLLNNQSGLPLYFSNTYNYNQFSHATKFKNLKNFFSSTTPKYAYAYYSRLDDELLGWDDLKTYFSFFKPSYWNLKKGLDSHPHEHWSWWNVLWWEDPVPATFSRFLTKRREEFFDDLDAIDSSSLNWFYRSWFHEEIFMELHASYYRTYYNIDYLTPGWRIQTDYPVKRMGHFDPKWHERLHEYVIYPYMNLFYPSTKRYYIDYYKHPDYVDSRSFLVLNFAWKLNTLPLFFYKFRPKFRKIIRSKSKYSNSLDSLKPDFKQLSNDHFLVNFFPLIFLNAGNDFWGHLDTYQNNLLFLVNIFTKNSSLPDLKLSHLEYLFSFLNTTNPIIFNRDDFVKEIYKKNWNSYSALCQFLVETFFITPSEFSYSKERIIAEYIAFKRFYFLLLSEIENFS